MAKKTRYVVTYVADFVKGLTESLTFKSQKEARRFIETRKPYDFKVDVWADNIISTRRKK